MNETQLKDMLTQTDQAFGMESSAEPAALAQAVCRRVAAGRKRRTQLAAGGTLIVLLAVGLLGYNQYNRFKIQKQLALQAEIQKELTELKAETQRTLALIQSVNQRTKKRKQLTALQRRLASITANTQNRQRQNERKDQQLAAKLYQKAETLSAQANSCNAVKTLYQQIVRTFPNSSYTQQAKTKLSQLDCLNGIHL